jgi:hypothetical protein
MSGPFPTDELEGRAESYLNLSSDIGIYELGNNPFWFKAFRVFSYGDFEFLSHVLSK